VYNNLYKLNNQNVEWFKKNLCEVFYVQAYMISFYNLKNVDISKLCNHLDLPELRLCKLGYSHWL